MDISEVTREPTGKKVIGKIGRNAGGTPKNVNKLRFLAYALILSSAGGLFVTGISERRKAIRRDEEACESIITGIRIAASAAHSKITGSNDPDGALKDIALLSEFYGNGIKKCHGKQYEDLDAEFSHGFYSAINDLSRWMIQAPKTEHKEEESVEPKKAGKVGQDEP